MDPDPFLAYGHYVIRFHCHNKKHETKQQFRKVSKTWEWKVFPQIMENAEKFMKMYTNAICMQWFGCPDPCAQLTYSFCQHYTFSFPYAPTCNVIICYQWYTYVKIKRILLVFLSTFACRKDKIFIICGSAKVIRMIETLLYPLCMYTVCWYYPADVWWGSMTVIH